MGGIFLQNFFFSPLVGSSLLKKSLRNLEMSAEGFLPKSYSFVASIMCYNQLNEWGGKGVMYLYGKEEVPRSNSRARPA